MDKVELSNRDIEELLSWRDQHIAEVRSHPAPLKAVEIVCKESGFTIKGIRKNDDLRLYLGRGGRSLGYTEFRRRIDGMWVSGKNRMKATQDMVQSVLTVYCSLMALMVSGMEPSEGEEPVERQREHKPSKSQPKRSSKRTTYILRRAGGAILVAPSGSHRSPSGTFTVRGHFRHYKSGKVVWIAEYKKGTGKKKPKTYKLGGKRDDEQR